jgi:CRP-like cAMP-binding protein
MHDQIFANFDPAQIPLFDGLGEADVWHVLDAMVARPFDPGEVILRQETVTQNVWLLLEGKCQVVKEPPLGELGRTVTLAEIEPFETFGEMTLFLEEPHTATVSATTHVKTSKLSKSDFGRLMDDHPHTACRLVCNLIKILSQRLRRMDSWIADLLDEREDMEIREQWSELRDRLKKAYPGQIV